MALRIDHIEFAVRDLPSHLAMFERLGFRVMRWTTHNGSSVELQLPGENQPVIELHQLVGGDEQPGVQHLAFACEDLDLAHTQLVEGGIKFHSCGCCDGPHVANDTGRRLWNLRDPDGWRLQLVDGA